MNDELRDLLRKLPPGDTESTDSRLSEFDCESVPIPPGTKSKLYPTRPSKPTFVMPWWGWLIYAATLAAAWLAGALSGFPLR